MIEQAFGPLLKMIGFDYKNKRAKDKELLNEFLALLAPDGASIDILKNTDMGDPIPVEAYSCFYKLRDHWRGPDKEFQVRKLDSKKNEFLDALEEFMNAFSEECGADGRGYLSIGMNDLDDREYMFDYRDRLNDLATKAYKKYDDLVRNAKREI